MLIHKYTEGMVMAFRWTCVALSPTAFHRGGDGSLGRSTVPCGSGWDTDAEAE